VYVEGSLAQLNFEHGHDSGEFEVIKTFLKRLILIIDGDVGDLVDLVEPFNAMLDEFTKFYSGFNSVRDAFDDYEARLVLGFVEKINCTLKVPADANLTLNADFVLGKSLLRLLDSSVLFSHVKGNL
jgi:hypothetical protein